MIVGLIFAAAMQAQDWPQWRGPARDGVARGLDRRDWPEKLNTKWRVKAGTGHSSPLVAGDRVFLFTREGGDEVTRMLDLASGKVIWRQAYAAPYRINPAAAHHGEGPKSTPVLTDGRLFTLGISGMVTAWDAASGKQLWRYAGEFKQTSPLYGTAMSPAVFDGLLIAHLGGHDEGALVALEAATGKVRWRWAGDGPGYASPVLAEFSGVKQVITETQNHVIALSLDKGELLWKLPLKTPWDQNSVTPIIHRDMVVVGGLDNPLTALRPVKAGAAWKAEMVWETKDAGGYMNTGVARGDLLFGMHFKNRGQYFCLDLRNGKVLWRSEPRQGDNAAIVLAGENLVLLSSGAEMIVARAAGDAYKVVRQYKVADTETWAYPVLTKGGVLVKDLDSLVYWSFD